MFRFFSRKKPLAKPDDARPNPEPPQTKEEQDAEFERCIANIQKNSIFQMMLAENKKILSAYYSQDEAEKKATDYSLSAFLYSMTLSGDEKAKRYMKRIDEDPEVARYIAEHSR